MAKTSVAVGPWGGSGGTRWDDGTNFDGIRSFTIFSGAWIDSITVVYDKNGEPIDEGKHGGNGGGAATVELQVTLQFPDEYLIGASGTYALVPNVGTTLVKSLTFRSNKRTFGPYGTQDGTAFSLPIEGGRIVSFTGRSGVFLDAIGFHIANN